MAAHHLEVVVVEKLDELDPLGREADTPEDEPHKIVGHTGESNFEVEENEKRIRVLEGVALGEVVHFQDVAEHGSARKEALLGVGDPLLKVVVEGEFDRRP